MYYKINKDADLSNTSYRCRKDVGSNIYIEYNDGFIGNDWVIISKEDMAVIVPEWFAVKEDDFELTQLDRIESAISQTLEDIKAEAVDEYTLSLMANNII